MNDEKNEKNLDLSELLIHKMQQNVKNKQGGIILNDEGEPMTSIEAIAMSIMQNAMKGDTASILLVRNLTKKPFSQEEADKRSEVYAEKLQHYIKCLKDELDSDGLWIGQVIDVEQVAKTMVLLDRMESIMQEPDYEDLITEIRKDGTQTIRLNPLHERLDELQRQVSEGRKKLRTEAIMRKQLQRQNNKIQN